MKRSMLMQKDREDLIDLASRLKPEERLLAFLHHSELMSRIRLEGKRHRSAPAVKSRRKNPGKS